MLAKKSPARKPNRACIGGDGGTVYPEFSFRPGLYLHPSYDGAGRVIHNITLS